MPNSSLEALHRTHRRLRLVIAHLPQGIVVADHAGTILLANHAGALLFAPSVEDAEGRRFPALAVARAERQSAPWVREVVTPRGERRAMRVVPLRDDTEEDAACLLCLTVDATESHHLPLNDQLLREIVDHLPNLVYGKNDTGHFIYANRATATALGTTVEHLIGHHESEFAPMLADSGRLRALDAVEGGEAGGSVASAEQAVTDATGSHRVLRTVALAAKERAVFGICTDVTEQRRMEGNLRIATEVFERCRESIMVTDPLHCVIFVNPAFTTMTGYAAEEIIGRSADTLRSGGYDAAFYANIWSDVDALGYWQGCLSSRRKSGDLYDQWLSITAVRDGAGTIERYISIAADITSHKYAQARANYLANYDTVTGLPNRALLQQRLTALIDKARDAADGFAVLHLGVERFKDINDTFGHQVGDLVLREFAVRLQSALPSECTVARCGDNEFVLLIPRADEGRAARLVEELRERLTRPLAVGGLRLSLNSSVGISIYPQHSEAAAELLKYAELALRHARQHGPNGTEVFTPSMTRAAVQRARVETGLRRALEGDGLRLHYQPQVNLLDGNLVGAEALLRWYDPGRGLIAPGEFIAIAEESGLIVPIGEWVIAEVCRQQRSWRAAGHPLVPIAVNVSALQFQHVGFVAGVTGLLARHAIGGEALCLEITESVLLRSPQIVGDSMRQLADAGVRLALDDFGTGFSSLNYLKQLPLHRLKIDKSFVNGLPNNEHDAAIVRAVLSLAHHLGMEVVAEGVESRQQAHFLARGGCHFGQGFLWSKAVSPADFARCLLSGVQGAGASMPG